MASVGTVIFFLFLFLVFAGSVTVNIWGGIKYFQIKGSSDEIDAKNITLQTTLNTCQTSLATCQSKPSGTPGGTVTTAEGFW